MKGRAHGEFTKDGLYKADYSECCRLIWICPIWMQGLISADELQLIALILLKLWFLTPRAAPNLVTSIGNLQPASSRGLTADRVGQEVADTMSVSDLQGEGWIQAEATNNFTMIYGRRVKLEFLIVKIKTDKWSACSYVSYHKKR
jgi:hypothetical protein